MMSRQESYHGDQNINSRRWKRIRKLVADYLKNDGFDVIEAENGNKGIEAFYANADLDLVILDVMMPEKTDGKYVVRLEKNQIFRL